MLVPMRPSNEVLLRARVPGAKDRVGVIPFLLLALFSVQGVGCAHWLYRFQCS